MDYLYTDKATDQTSVGEAHLDLELEVYPIFEREHRLIEVGDEEEPIFLTVFTSA